MNKRQERRNRRYGMRAWLRVKFLRDPHCHYCNRETYLEPGTFQATVDHKQPRSLGGKNDPENYVLACRECNQDKRDIPYEEYKLRKSDAWYK